MNKSTKGNELKNETMKYSSKSRNEKIKIKGEFKGQE